MGGRAGVACWSQFASHARPGLFVRLFLSLSLQCGAVLRTRSCSMRLVLGCVGGAGKIFDGRWLGLRYPMMWRRRADECVAPGWERSDGKGISTNVEGGRRRGMRQ